MNMEVDQSRQYITMLRVDHPVSLPVNVLCNLADLIFLNVHIRYPVFSGKRIYYMSVLNQNCHIHPILSSFTIFYHTKYKKGMPNAFPSESIHSTRSSLSILPMPDPTDYQPQDLLRSSRTRSPHPG